MKRWGFLFFPAVSLGVGTLAGFLTRNSLNTVYPMLEKSPLTPPGWVFPLVWTVLYLLMGLGMALVVRRGGPEVRQALGLWGVQLGLNLYLVGFPEALTHPQYQSGVLQFIQGTLHGHGAAGKCRRQFHDGEMDK